MLFEIKVLRNGDISVLQHNAQRAKDAEIYAYKQGFSVLSVHKKGFISLAKTDDRVNFDLLLFSQEFVSLLDAGLSLIDVIDVLTEKELNQAVKHIFDSIRQHLYEGKPLSLALTFFPEQFPKLFIAMLETGEKTGEIQAIMTRFIAYQLQVETVKKKIIGTLIYPAILMVVGVLVSLFLIAYVVPRFSVVYESSGATLPWLSEKMLAWGRWLNNHYYEAIFLLILMTITTSYVLMKTRFRLKLFQVLQRIPHVGEQFNLYQLTRLYRAMAMLLQGGIPLIIAMEMSVQLLDIDLRYKMIRAIEKVNEGMPLSDAMEINSLTTIVSSRMLLVGEQTGNIGNMMERIANFYDEAISRWLEWAMRLFEPVLMLVIGIIIGLIVVMMYMPIFDLAESIQ